MSEVNACFIPLRYSPEAVNCEVRQQYQPIMVKLGGEGDCAIRGFHPEEPSCEEAGERV